MCYCQDIKISLEEVSKVTLKKDVLTIQKSSEISQQDTAWSGSPRVRPPSPLMHQRGAPCLLGVRPVILTQAVDPTQTSRAYDTQGVTYGGLVAVLAGGRLTPY